MLRFLQRFFVAHPKKRRYTPEEAAEARVRRELGMSEELIDNEFEFRRMVADTHRELAARNPSTAPTHGSPVGTRFQCTVCGRKMLKTGVAKGSAFFSRQEMLSGVHGVEECRECGRVWCENCFPSRPRNCECGINQDVIRIEDGVAYKGSVTLVKAQYLD
jgi:hypothetical protein